MRLLDVAKKFNNMVCVDAYTRYELFNGQLGLYDDNKRDSETSERRVLSLSADEVIPTRRAIYAAGKTWIVGHSNPDDYRGSTIRVGYVIQEAPFLSQVRTLAQACLNQPGFTAYAGRAWVKDIAYSQQDSEMIPLHHIHFASNEAITTDLLVTYEGRLNLVRSLNYGAGGTIVTACEQMQDPSIETGSLLIGTYNPATGGLTGTPAAVRVVRMRWQSLFAYRTGAAPKFEPGDIQIAISKVSANVVAGATITLSDGAWRIASVIGEGSVWLCRATRYA